MITLAIETSCDETAVCLLESTGAPENPSHEGAYSLLHYAIRGNSVLSQIELHRQYGGVFPAMAKREHSKNLVPLLEEMIKNSDVSMRAYTAQDPVQQLDFLKEKEPELLENLLKSTLLHEKPIIDKIVVTRGPGLEPALWVGVNCAQALGKIWDIPVVGVNHMEGHIVGSLLTSSEVAPFQPLRPIAFPALALLISGGHTELVLVKKIGDYSVIGRTKDDAVGEAFDKVARMLDLPYPGGVEISNLAAQTRATEINKKNNPDKIKITLPRPMINSHDLDFSFSGIKTAVLYTLQGDKSGKTNTMETIDEQTRGEIACEFEDAVTDVLIAKTKRALDQYIDESTPIASLIIGGGVSANAHIRMSFEKLTAEYSIPLYLPPAGVSGDNALMIAIAGALSDNATNTDASAAPTILRAHGNLSL